MIHTAKYLGSLISGTTILTITGYSVHEHILTLVKNCIEVHMINMKVSRMEEE